MDLPRYSVTIPSRFSPVKKPVKKFEFPKTISGGSLSPTKVSSTSVKHVTRKFDLPVQQQKCGLTSSIPVNRSVEQLERKASNSAIEIPSSGSIKSRVQNLEKIMAASANNVAPSPAPELLPLRMRKGLFEKKIRQEKELKEEEVKRNDFLSKKKIPQRESTTAFQSGLVKQMREKLWTVGQNGEPVLETPVQDSNESSPEKKVTPQKETDVGMDVVMEEEEEEEVNDKLETRQSSHASSRDSRVTSSSKASFVSTAVSTNQPKVNIADLNDEESALAHFFDTDSIESSPEAQAQSSRNYFAKPGMTNTTETEDDGDSMSLCTQSSNECHVDSQSPTKSVRSSNRIYPDLSEEEEEVDDLVLSPSPTKKCRMNDAQEETMKAEDKFSVSSEEEEPDELQLTDGRVITGATGGKTTLGTPLRTLSAYRLEQKAMQLTNSAKRTVIVSTSQEDREREREERQRQEALRRKISLLKKEDVVKYEMLANQSAQALQKCLTSDFKDTPAHADAERHLLVSLLQRQATVSYIHSLNSQIASPPLEEFVVGHLAFNTIDLPIMRDTLLAHKKGLVSKGNENHYFFCVVKGEGTVHSTECQSLADGYASGTLTFVLPSGFSFKDLKGNFHVRLEVYCITLQAKKEGSKHVMPKFPGLTPSKKKDKNSVQSALKSAQTVSCSPSLPVRLEPQAVAKGFVTINSKNIKKKEFELQGFKFESTLQGVVKLSMNVKAEYQGSYSNFLSFYDDKEEIGIWKRRWCRLEGPKILVWRLPEDEKSKPPQKEIDLRHCINPCLTPASFKVCPKKESFVMIFAGTSSDKTKARVNWLLNKSYSDAIDKTLVAADVIEERDEWIDILNRALEGIRSWDEEALLPCSSTEMETYLLD